MDPIISRAEHTNKTFPDHVYVSGTERKNTGATRAWPKRLENKFDAFATHPLTMGTTDSTLFWRFSGTFSGLTALRRSTYTVLLYLPILFRVTHESETPETIAFTRLTPVFSRAAACGNVGSDSKPVKMDKWGLKDLCKQLIHRRSGKVFKTGKWMKYISPPSSNKRGYPLN